MPTIKPRPPTLNAHLASLGWTHRSSRNPFAQGREIEDASGRVLGTYTACEAWTMLRERGLYRDADYSDSPVPGGAIVTCLGTAHEVAS